MTIGEMISKNSNAGGNVATRSLKNVVAGGSAEDLLNHIMIKNWLLRKHLNIGVLLIGTTAVWSIQPCTCFIAVSGINSFMILV